MKFQYGADSIDLLPQENSNLLVLPDIRKKLEAKKKEEAKLKTKLAAEKEKKPEYSNRYYNGTYARYSLPYKNRYTLYHNALSSWPEVTGVGSILQTGNYNYNSQPTLY